MNPSKSNGSSSSRNGSDPLNGIVAGQVDHEQARALLVRPLHKLLSRPSVRFCQETSNVVSDLCLEVSCRTWTGTIGS